MTEHQKEAYNAMIGALAKALDEIHNPGAGRSSGLDITGHIEATLEYARRHQPVISR